MSAYLRMAMTDVGCSIDTVEVFVSRFVVQVLFAAPSKSDRTLLNIGLKEELGFLLEPTKARRDRAGR